jgi:hypothetical protein
MLETGSHFMIGVEEQLSWVEQNSLDVSHGKPSFQQSPVGMHTLNTLADDEARQSTTDNQNV